MKNFKILCTYTQEHDTTESFIQQVMELVLWLDKHGWKAKEGYAGTEHIDADGDLVINLEFSFDCENLDSKDPGHWAQWKGAEITYFLDLCNDVCNDDEAVRIYDGGSQYEEKED